MSIRRWIDTINSLVEKHGCRVVGMAKGKHLKFRLDTPSGPKMLVCSLTPSCPRAEKNIKSDIKRWSRS